MWLLFKTPTKIKEAFKRISTGATSLKITLNVLQDLQVLTEELFDEMTGSDMAEREMKGRQLLLRSLFD